MQSPAFMGQGFQREGEHAVMGFSLHLALITQQSE